MNSLRAKAMRKRRIHPFFFRQRIKLILSLFKDA